MSERVAEKIVKELGKGCVGYQMQYGNVEVVIAKHTDPLEAKIRDWENKLERARQYPSSAMGTMILKSDVAEWRKDCNNLNEKLFEKYEQITTLKEALEKIETESRDDGFETSSQTDLKKILLEIHPIAQQVLNAINTDKDPNP